MGDHPDSFEEPASSSSSETAIREHSTLIVVNLLVSVATLATIIAVGFGIWYYNGPHSAGLPGRVLDSMNAYLSKDEQFRDLGLHANSITILHAAGNMYEGQATVTGNSGPDEHMVPVHVIYDGEEVFWRTDPGAFLFTVKDALGTS